ncbi:unnamed protein product [Lymnaea stagnalis]|uniref:RETREG1-3/ARL6IP-like N-terminal reticulon-homology domain-containing protein n=1 Tax=Lymnaea stagnalis TaxID=6523 RepID=A0AAV2IE82_LYMST
MANFNIVSRKRAQMPNMAEMSFAGGGEFTDEVSDIKRDLSGWKEVLLPLESLLLWNQPYYPAIIVGTTTFLFSLVWYTEMSALTALSFLGMIIGIVDFIVPFMGPTITGYKSWGPKEESDFTAICEKVAGIRQEVIDTWRGLSTMRHQNAKLFFFIVMAILTITAWIGNLIDNLVLFYLIVNFVLLTPGLRHHQLTSKYVQPIIKAMNRVVKATTTVKEKEN